MENLNKKGQTGGLIMGLVMGIASLVIGVIIAFVIVSTLTNADLLTATRSSNSVTNETEGWVNSTGYQLAGLDAYYVPGTISITAVYNETDDLLVPSSNYTVSSIGLIENVSSTIWFNTSLSYSWSIYSAEELATTNLDANFTAGIDEVSAKIPTVLLIASIVLILGVMVLLVAAWQRMRMGSTGI